ncbi:MAG: hypothetical protein A2075_03915 [Geobacteraceae bacterium GWC2_58_44]|nr:MAG: hypothetical protein A2075_03915 [Geobacteraceae bacterium GWC2_58_44]HBG07541.1 hypothetical protein [Geobacter sp.]
MRRPANRLGPVKLPAFPCRLLWSKLHVFRGALRGHPPQREHKAQTARASFALAVAARGRPPPPIETIKEALESGLIRPYDETAARKMILHCLLGMIIFVMSFYLTGI